MEILGKHDSSIYVVEIQETTYILAAYGITNANPQFGKGGLPEYFVPNVQDLIDKGILIPVDSIKLIK